MVDYAACFLPNTLTAHFGLHLTIQSYIFVKIENIEQIFKQVLYNHLLR